MKSFFRAVLLAMSIAAAGSVWAQAFPSKPIKIITGWGPGGSGYAVTHLYVEELSRQLGQPVVVEDKPGASNTIAARAAMAAAPDGYVLHMGGINAHPALFKNGVDSSKVFEPVGLVAAIPMAVVTSAAHPLKTLDELREFSQRTPGGVFFGSTAGGAAQYLMMALLAQRVGIKFTHVPFKGTGELQTALARGDAHVAFLTAASAQPLIKAGKMNALVIGGTARSSLLPDVPTFAEAGIKPFSAESIMMMWAPKGTPADIVRKLNEATRAVAKNPEFVEAMKTRTGLTPVALTSEQMLKMYQDAIADVTEAAALVNYKPE